MGTNEYRSELEPSTGMHVVLNRDGSQRIPFGRTHDAKQRAAQAAALFSGDWAALRFAGVELPLKGSDPVDTTPSKANISETGLKLLEEDLRHARLERRRAEDELRKLKLQQSSERVMEVDRPSDMGRFLGELDMLTLLNEMGMPVIIYNQMMVRLRSKFAAISKIPNLEELNTRFSSLVVDSLRRAQADGLVTYRSAVDRRREELRSVSGLTNKQVALIAAE